VFCELSIKEGYEYKKAGVILSDFAPIEQVQQNLFDTTNYQKHNKLMEALDKITAKMGKGAVKLASEGIAKPWQTKRKFTSPAYTTKLSDILAVK
jgi:DNA polymerase V